MATEDDVPQNQSAFAEEVEKKDRKLLTTTSGTEIDELSQVEEKKVQALTEEPHATMKTNSEVETTKEFIAGNTGPRDGEIFLESPMLFEIAGEENSSSSQVYNGKDMKNEANRGKSKKNLIAEEDLQYQEVEVTIKEASLPGTQPNAEEESRDLNRDEAGCIAREETIMDLQEATSAQTTEVKDHLPDSTQDINVDTAKLVVTGNQGAGQMNTFNISIASFEDLHEAGLLIKKDLAISSILDSKRMEPQGQNSSLNVEDETTEEVQRSFDSTRNFPSGIECKSDHTEVAKENSQDVEVLRHSVKEEDEYLSAFLRNVSSKTECGSNHSEATDETSQDDEMLPASVIGGREIAKEVESLSEHTRNVSIEIECGKKHGETTKGNPQDAEKLLHSVDMGDETTKKVEISSDLAENVSIEIENGTNDCEVIEGTTENTKILPHSVILEDETTEKVENLLEHTRTVSIEAECGSDPSKETKANIQDAEILFHSVEVEDEKIKKAGCMSGLARNVSVETEGGRNYIEATKEEISENIEILPGNSLITPSMTGTRTLEAEPCKTSCEIKSTDNGKEKESLELKRSDLGGTNVSISSAADCPNKHEKEDVENGCHVEQVSSPLVNAFTEEILLKDVGPEKVRELEAHTVTIFEEDGDREDTSYVEPAPVKEVLDMVPIVAKENQSAAGNQNKFLEEVATVKSTESAMVKAEERPESSSNESLMKKEETLEKESQEQILVELLAGEDRQDEVSKGLTEANIDAEVLVKPEIFNTEKDLEALLPKNEPGKENHNESLQAASMPLEKIDSSQHSERTTAVQEQRSIECFQGGLSEEMDSTSNASKRKAEDSPQENIMIDGSNKEVDCAVLNDTVQEMYETGQCPESTTLEELSAVEESSLELRSTTETEGDKYEKNDLIDIEEETQKKDEVPSGKEENFAPQSCTDNKRKLVEDLSVGENKTECPKGETDYINDYEEVRGNDSEEAASDLKEDHMLKQVQKDTFSKDEERETQTIAKEQIVTENSVKSSAAENNKSNHEVKIEAANPEADVHKGEAIYSNDDDEIKRRGSDEGAPELRDQIAAKEAHMDTLCKDEEKETQTIDKEVVKEYLVESFVAEEYKSLHEVKTEATNPEDGNKGEAFYSNDNEEIKDHGSKEGALEVKEDHTVAEEAYKDACSKDEEKEAQIIDKEEVATEYLVESSVAGKNKSDHKVKTEATNPEADDVHKGEAVYSNDDKEITGNDSAAGAPELKEDQMLAEESHKGTFSKDDGREIQKIDKEEAAAEYSVIPVAEKNKSDNEIRTKETNPEPDELHKGKADHHNDNEQIKGNDSEEGAPEPKEDRIAAEEIYKDTVKKDEEKEIQIIDKGEVTTEYLIQASVAGKNKSDHEVKTEETNHEADDVHKGEAVYRNDDEKIKGNDSAEGALELKEDQISAEQVDRDVFRKDDKKETQIIDKQEAATESVESSVTVITSEVTNLEADEVQGKADHLNYNKEIERNYSEEVASKPKEYRIAAEEVHKDAFSKDEEKEKQMIDKQEVATEYLVESSVTEENKSHHKLKTEPVNPEADDVHKREAFYSNDDEEIKGIHSEEGAPELEEDRIIAEEAHKDIFSKDEEKGPTKIDKELAATEYMADSSVAEENKSDHEVTAEMTNPEADELHKGKADHLNDDEEIKSNDSQEEAPEPKEDQIAAEEVHKEMFSKDKEKETQIIDKEEVATECLEQFSVAEENKSDELHKGKADHPNDDEEIKGNDSQEEAPEPKEDQIAAEEVCLDHQNKSGHKVTTKAMNPEADDVHKGEVVYRNEDENIKSNGSEEAAPELKDQILAEEACNNTFSKDEEKDAQIIDKGLAATEYLGESSAAEENKSHHEITTEVTDPEGDEVHKGTADLLNDEEIEGNDREEVAPELKADQIVAEEVHKDIFRKDAEKEMEIIDKDEVATEYFLESYVAEANKSNHKVTTEARNPEAGDVRKREAVYMIDDEEINGIDSEEGAPEQKEDQILAEEACKDKRKDTRIIEKEEVATEYSLESSVAEENKSNHMVKAEATNPEADELHKGKADHPNDEEVIEGKDPEEVAPEPNEDQIAAEEVYKDTSSKDVQKEAQIIDKEKVVAECLVESSVAETEKSDYKATIQEAGDIHNSAENIDAVENKKTKNELQESVFEYNFAEDKIMTQVPSQKKTKEEFGPERDFATSSAEERKVEDSCEENQKGKLDRERIPQCHDIEKQSAKETDSSNDCYTTSLEEEIVQESFQEDEANKKKSADTQMNKEEILNLAVPISMHGERSVEGSPKKEERDVMEPEKETKDVVIEGTTKNDKATYTAQEGEKVTVNHEGNAGVAGDTAATIRLPEVLTPREYQEQAENSSAVPEISEKSKEKMLDTMESAEIRSVEGGLKKEERDVPEPQENETKDVDIEGTTHNVEATHFAQEGEMETIKHEGNADVAGDTAGTIRLAEGLPPTEYQEQAGNSNAAPETSEQSKEEMLDTKVSIEIRSVEGSLKEEEWDVMEPEKETKHSDREGTKQNDEATLSAQEAEMETVKHGGNTDAAGTDGLRETLPPREYQELVENSNAVPDIFGETNEKMLDTTELTEIRPVEGTLKQGEQVVMEQEKETKCLHIEGTTQNNEATHTAQEGQEEKLKHEGNPDAAGTNRLTEGLPSIEYQELAENSTAMPDTMESEEIKLVEGSSKQEERDVMEPEKETKDLDREGTRQKKDEATLSAKEDEKDIVKHEGNPDAVGTDGLTEELPAREYQEVAESSSMVPDISKERNEKMLDTTEWTKISLVEGSSKQKEWAVMEPKKETKDLHEEGTTQNDEATHSAEGEKEMVKNEGNANAAGAHRPAEELLPREHQELAENSSAVPEISENSKEKMLDTIELTDIIQVEESSKQEEWDVMEPEKETKDLDKEGTTQKDEPTLSAQECGNKTVKYEGIPDAAVNDRLTEGLPPREYQELVENSSVVRDISEERNEIMLDTTESTEIKAVEGSSKQEEWDVMEPEKATRDLDREATAQNVEAMLSAQEGEKETVKHEGNPDAADTDRLTEGLPPKECQELAENSSAVPDIPEERNEIMSDTTFSKVIKLVEGSSKQEEWDVMEPEKETKDLDREGTTQKDEATLSAEEGEKETVKHKGNPEAAGTNRLTEGLLPREYKELAENSSAVPDISEERNEKMLDTKEPLEIINPVEGICKQEEWDVMEPEKETKDLQIEGTRQNQEATHSAREVEKKIIKHERNANAAGMDRLAEELPPREYPELSENSSTVPEISEKSKEKMFDTMESTETRPVEGSLKQEELDVIEPENKTKDLDREGTTDNDEATHSAQEGDKEMVRQEGNPNAVGNDRLTEVLPPIEYQELAVNSGEVPEISEGGNEKMLDITESTEIRPIEGSLKEEEWDVLEREKKTKDVDIEGTALNDEATHSAQEGETNTVEHEVNADVEGDTAGTVRMAEGLPQREYKELAENSSAMPEVSERSKEKVLDNTEPTEIAVIGDRKEVKLQENMQLVNNTPTPDKVDLQDALKPEVQPRSKTVEISKFIKISSESAKMPSEDETIGEPYQDSVLEEKDARNIKEKNRISELQEEDGNSHSRNMNTEVKSLNEKVDSSKVLLPPEIDEEGHAQENIVRKDSEVNSTSTFAAPLVDNITAGESPEGLRELMVSEDRLVWAVNETNEDHKNNEYVAKINTMEKTEQNCIIIETESTQKVKAEAQGRSSEEEEQQQMAEEQVQFSTRTTETKLYKKDILARKGENEDRTFRNEDENYDNQLLELEPTIKELQVEKEELQNAFAFFVVPEARGLKQAAEDMKSIDEHRETPESKVKEVPKREILPKAEAGEIQDPFNDSYIETMTALDIQGKRDHVTNTGTKPSSGDEKLQLLQQGPVEKIFQPSMEILESTDASNAVEGAKGDEHLENVKMIDNCQSTEEKYGSTTVAESSQSDLEQPATEPQQKQDVREAHDQCQNLHGLCDINSSALVVDTKDAPFCAASANEARIPLEIEKLDTVPFSRLEKSTQEEADTNNSSTDSKNILQLQQEAIMESFEAVGDNLEPSKVKSEEAPHWEEKGTNEEATLASKPREASSTTLSDLLRASKKDISRVTNDFTEETEPNVQKEEMKDFKTEMADREEPKTDEEGEGDEDKRKESAYDSPVAVEAPSDIDIKAAHKKSHNILSGVGSKVKHSIAKVKKAITGKSSHPKPPSPK